MSFDTRYGPTALVTGAANGIGRACAFGLARRGLSLLLIDVDAEALAATADGIRAEAGVSVDTCLADLSDSVEIDRVCDVAGYAEIGLLVNNAGIGHSAAFLEIPIEEHRKALEVNVGAALGKRHTVVPGFANKLEAIVFPRLPRRMILRRLGRDLTKRAWHE